jgi:CO/xanthine dehydrogenase Mo-binding subunit
MNLVYTKLVDLYKGSIVSHLARPSVAKLLTEERMTTTIPKMTVREAADRLGKTPSAIRSRHLARLGAVKILGEWVLDPQRVEAEARGIPAEQCLQSSNG